MTDKEFIKSHVEALRDDLRSGVPIIISVSRAEGLMSILTDILEKDESVAPSWGNGKAFCGACGKKFMSRGEVYCHNCGRKINW